MNNPDLPTIEVEGLKQKIDAGEVFTLLDVREPHEVEYCRLPIPGVLIPLQQLPARLAELNKDDTYLVLCRVGGRSAMAVQYLRQAGFDAFNIAGGINAWSRRIDPTVPAY